jgi:hypothetical protein
MPASPRLARLTPDMSGGAAEPRLCRLEQAVGIDAACPMGGCAFWEPGGTVLDGSCAVQGMDFSRDQDLARWLLGIRRRLEQSTAAPGE